MAPTSVAAKKPEPAPLLTPHDRRPHWANPGAPTESTVSVAADRETAKSASFPAQLVTPGSGDNFDFMLGEPAVFKRSPCLVCSGFYRVVDEGDGLHRFFRLADNKKDTK